MKRARIESPSSANHVATEDSASRVPRISRKVNACTECQARKVKCDAAPPEKTVCSRCLKKGLRCVVNKSLQSLLEEGAEWRSSVEEDTQCLQSAVSRILSVLDLPQLETFARKDASQQPSNGAGRIHSAASEFTKPRTASMAMTRESSQEPEAKKMNGVLVSAPMGSLFEVTKLRNLRTHPHSVPKAVVLEDDFVSKGQVSETEAQELFETFAESFNHYLWGGIALVHDSLTSARKSSSLLVAAILTVTALHIPGKEETFDACYAEFIALVSESMFDRYHNLDGIRGLCIGAFWLSDVSWKLSGHAVRIATELNLHQSCARAMRGMHEHIESARLWYFLYVCDHHFSIAYGRPPVIHDSGLIIKHEQFMDLPGATQADLRLHSQVSLFITLTEVYNTFGPDIEQALSENDLVRLQHFNLTLDDYRVKWEPQLTPSTFIGNYPAKGVGLHYNFAKLQVNSLALRGIQPSTSNLSTSRQQLANLAIKSAISTLEIVLDEPDIRRSVVGVPIYLHTMITYSGVFLLKVQQKWNAFRLEGDPAMILDLVNRAIGMLKEANAGERHLSCYIAAGLRTMLDRFTSWEVVENLQSNSAPAVTSNIAQDCLPSCGMRSEDDSVGLQDKSMLLYDEEYFPMGFFDVLSSTHFDQALWGQD